MGEDTYEGTLTNPLSQTLYTYVHNNPLRYIDPSGHFAFDTSDKVELKNLLDEAKEKSKSNRNNKYYKVYKDFVRDRYDFVSIMGENRYNYLFDLLTGTSPYTNNAGNSSKLKEFSSNAAKIIFASLVRFVEYKSTFYVREDKENSFEYYLLSSTDSKKAFLFHIVFQ